MADPYKSVRQDVLREQIKKAIDIHSHYAMLTSLSVILVVIGYFIIRDFQYSGVGDSHSVGIAGDILEHLTDSLCRRSGIDHPVLVKAELPGSVVNGYTDVLESSGQQCHESSPEPWTHGCYRKEEVAPFASSEMMPYTGLVRSTTRHNAVKMRVIEEIGTPCMEDGRHACADSLTFCKDLERVPSRLEHAVVENGLMSHCYRMQRCRHSEDDVEVLRRDNLFPSESDPLFALFVLTLGAMTIPATVVTDLHLTALRTRFYMTSKCFCPAKRHVSEGLSDRRNNLMRIEKLSSMFTDNLTDVKSGPHLLEGRGC